MTDSQRAPLVDGRPTSAYPAVVGLVDHSGVVYCTGTAIDSRLVITAGHCIFVAEGLPAAVTDGARSLKVRPLERHPDYRPGSFSRDLGLVELEEGRLVPQIIAAAPPAGAEVHLVGWGSTGPVDGDGGQKRYRTTRVIAGPHGSMLLQEGSCFGDSGGAVLDLTREARLVAVISGGGWGCEGPVTVNWLRAPEHATWWTSWLDDSSGGCRIRRPRPSRSWVWILLGLLLFARRRARVRG